MCTMLYLFKNFVHGHNWGSSFGMYAANDRWNGFFFTCGMPKWNIDDELRKISHVYKKKSQFNGNDGSNKSGQIIYGCGCRSAMPTTSTKCPTMCKKAFSFYFCSTYSPWCGFYWWPNTNFFLKINVSFY